MSEPLVSVFLPTHARFKSGLLSKAVESVLAQSYKNFEFLIVDDASTDGAAQYISEISKRDRRVKHIRFDKHIGLPAFTLAHAYLQSKGEILAFAFDDAEWLSHHLEVLTGCLQNNPVAGMAYGGVRVYLPRIAPQILGQKEYDLDKLTEYNYIGNCGVALRRNIVDQVGWYDPHILVKRSCDWDLWKRIGKKKIPVVCCNDIIAEEKGPTQIDSLGTSVSLHNKLTRKYQTTERDHRLSPPEIAEGRAPMFDAFEWMHKEEIQQLRSLAFEHYLRTSQLTETVQLSKKWLAETQGNDNLISERSDIENLTLAFNLYFTETSHLCKSTCESAYKSIEVSDAYNILQACYEQLGDYHNQLRSSYRDLIATHCQTDDQYHAILDSLSWRITKPIRELKHICRSNKFIHQIVRFLISSLRRSRLD